MNAPRIAATCLAFALPLAACGSPDEQRSEGRAARAASTASVLPQGSEHVDLATLGLTTTIDNEYLPMARGSRWVYRETDAEGIEQRIVVTVTNEEKQVDGIDVLVVRDTVTQAGALVEDTRDWYAQDRDGNVWYLGEKTAEYEGGKQVSTDGSWEAGVDGAQAGVLVPANPQPGMSYREEYDAGEAEDEARILSVDEFAEVPFRAFGQPDLLMTRNVNPLEPEQLEYKLYAPGVGLVLVLQASGGSAREELLSFVPGRATA